MLSIFRFQESRRMSSTPHFHDVADLGRHLTVITGHGISLKSFAELLI